MPLTLATGAQLVASNDFQYRVGMAFYFVARQVLAEESTVYGHEQRVNFARSIILQPVAQFMQYAAMVATNQAIVDGGPYVNATNTLDQTKVPDGRIIDAVAGMWNWLAAVR